jgi:uncharacterized protein
MQSKMLASAGLKTFAVIFQTGEEAMSGLLEFAKQYDLASARFTGIGAFSSAVLGYFDWKQKDYIRIPVEEQVEVVSLIGDIATEKGKPKVHMHCVLAKRDGSTVGGHLLEGHVRPTLEIVLDETPAQLRREFDPQSGLALIRL